MEKLLVISAFIALIFFILKMLEMKYIDKEMKPFKNIIGGYHLSENNGKIDSNKPFTNKSWFWKLLNKNLNYYSIEVYNESIIKIKDQIKIANEKINS